MRLTGAGSRWGKVMCGHGWEFLGFFEKDFFCADFFNFFSYRMYQIQIKKDGVKCGGGVFSKIDFKRSVIFQGYLLLLSFF
jgi:hypothetical protein